MTYTSLGFKINRNKGEERILDVIVELKILRGCKEKQLVTFRSDKFGTAKGLLHSGKLEE